MTFEKLFSEYLKSPGFTKLATRSKIIYMGSGARLSKYFGKADVKKLKRSDFIRLQNDHAQSPASANLLVRVASVVFSFALDMDIVPTNPVMRLKKLKIGSHEKWTPEEVKKVIALRDRRISTAVALAWYTGQRESDILSMQWKDFDGEYIAMVQGKTGLEMKIKVHPDLAAYLETIREDAAPSDFIVSGKKIVKSSAFRNMLKRRLDALGIDKVFHGIRKGVASSLAENRAPLSEIAAIMGHKSLRMAAYYAEQANNKVLTDNAVDSLPSCV